MGLELYFDRQGIVSSVLFQHFSSMTSSSRIFQQLSWCLEPSHLICVLCNNSEQTKCEGKGHATSRFVVAVQWLSHVWLFVTLWTAATQASLSSTISQSLLKFISIELVMLSIHFILCHPLLLLLSGFLSIRVFLNELALCIRWPKDWSLSFSNSPSSEYSGLISFRIDWFDLLAVQGTLKSSPTPQFESIDSVLSLLYGPALTSIHDYWKNHSFDYMALCQQSNVSGF